MGASKWIGITVLAGVLVLARAAPASAAQVIGQNGPVNGCGTDQAYTMTAAEAPGSTSYSPSSYGVITSWTGMADATGGGTLRLLIMKPDPGTGPNNFIVVHKDQVRTLTQASALNTFTGIRIPIEAAERLGLYVPPTQPFTGDCDFGSGVIGNSIRWPNAGGDPPENTSIDFPNSFDANLNASAVVEPDTDRDVFGDETQDKCLGTPGQFNGCPNTVAIGKVKQKGTKPKIKVSVTVPGPGTLRAGSPNDPALAAAAAIRLKAVTQAFTATTAQQVTLTLKLTKSAKRKLADKGKLKVKIKLSYTPTGGPAGSQTAKAKLKS
jgi:hypothetical protein